MPRKRHSVSARRRQAIAALGGGAAFTLAGCLGDDEDDAVAPEVPDDRDDVDFDDVERDDDTDDTDDPDELVDQDFVVHMEENPEEITFWWFYDLDRFFEVGVDLEDRHMPLAFSNRPQFLANFKGDRTFYVAPSEMEPRIASVEYLEGEDVEFERSNYAFQYEIVDHPVTGEPQYWSDGEPITARDLCGGNFYNRLGDEPWDAFAEGVGGSTRQGWEEVAFPDGPTGRTVQYSDRNGNAGNSWSLGRWRYENTTRISSYEQVGGLTPTHLHPFEEIFEASLEQWDHFLENPDEATGARQWYVENIVMEPNGPVSEDLNEAYEWQDPDEVVTHGAFHPVEIRGAEEVILERNPHWTGPEPNFERVRCVYADADERQVAELMAGRLDHYPHELPAELFDQVPDKYESIEVQTHASGDGLGLNHGDTHLGNRNVRAAINRALDKEFLAEAVGHEELGFPINVPGWDNAFSHLSPGIDEEWATENLDDYTYDPDAADAQMQEEGYARNGDGVWELDGDPMEYELHTADTDTSFEHSVSDMLGDWGVSIDIQGLDDAAYEESYERGEFDLWTSSTLTSNFRSVGLDAWRSITGSMTNFTAYGMFPQEDIGALGEILPAEQTSTGGWYDTPEKEALQVAIPEIGDIDGPRTVEFSPGSVAYDTHYNVHDEDLMHDEEHWTLFHWFTNWYLADIPCYATANQTWINTENWDWSAAQDHFMWEFIAGGYAPRGRSGWHIHEMVPAGFVMADPDNPK